jgi:hypothetical protein
MHTDHCLFYLQNKSQHKCQQITYQITCQTHLHTRNLYYKLCLLSIPLFFQSYTHAYKPYAPHLRASCRSSNFYKQQTKTHFNSTASTTPTHFSKQIKIFHKLYTQNHSYLELSMSCNLTSFLLVLNAMNLPPHPCHILYACLAALWAE